MLLLTNIITGMLSSLIGTWLGAWIIIKRQEASSAYPRKLMLDVLSELEKYETYQKAENTFNNRSTIEKKAVLVALKNLGIPLKISVINDAYDTNNIRFDCEQVDKTAIHNMKNFVKKGLCDDLFFKEIESNFYNAPPKTIYARALAIRFLDALELQPDTATIQHVFNAAKMNINQFEIIQVFYNTVDFLENKKLCKTKINNARTNVQSGVFDHLFYWDIRAFENMNSQRNAADYVNRLALSSEISTYLKSENIGP